MKLIILIAGLPAAGKTTTAKRLSTGLSAILLATDLLRKNILEYPSYSDEKKRELVYEALLEQASDVIKKQNTIIIDATFSLKRRREMFYNLAGQNKADIIVIKCFCDEEKIISRIEERKENPDFSDIKKKSQYYEVKEQFEDFSEDVLPGGKPVKLIEYSTDTRKTRLKNIEMIKMDDMTRKIVDILNG
jgi:hypothetical protein